MSYSDEEIDTSGAAEEDVPADELEVDEATSA